MQRRRLLSPAPVLATPSTPDQALIHSNRLKKSLNVAQSMQLDYMSSLHVIHLTLPKQIRLWKNFRANGWRFPQKSTKSLILLSGSNAPQASRRQRGGLCDKGFFAVCPIVDRYRGAIFMGRDASPKRHSRKRLVTGMPGTGKSTALALLGERGRRVVDTDTDKISRRLRMLPLPCFRYHCARQRSSCSWVTGLGR